MCSKFRWLKFKKQYGLGLFSNIDCSYKDNLTIGTRSSASNVLIFYPRYDPSRAFCIDDNVCGRMMNWRARSSSVTLTRVRDLATMMSILGEYADNSIKHLVIGGHGTSTTLALGVKQGKKICGDTSICVKSGRTRVLLELVAEKMMRAGSIFLDSCLTAKKTADGDSLMDYIGRVLSSVAKKGLRIIGATESFKAVDVQVYEPFLPHVGRAAQGNPVRVLQTEGVTCPAYAASSAPDADGLCECKPGRRCIFLGRDGRANEACPVGPDERSSTRFIATCGTSWASRKCICT
eukprot:TRINITY_DN37512_c0_g1_i1.p1 TRINITY_DN37512_c0_g1~~TRINITY_DN37512_c0_g1_i1.p1  ORF type:complete len:292 (+),score=45.69 TRINITY_DN37512_c0_g1_i1:498-1373(+)